MINPKVRNIIWQNVNWSIIAVFFFFTGIVTTLLFFGNEQLFLHELTETQHQALQQMAEIVFEGSPLRGALFLFANNLLASVSMMFFGIILGIPTLLGLFTNGVILGSVSVALAAEGIPVLSFVLLGILPHGIFELSAFFISAAFGLKLGFHLVFPLPGKKRGESLLTVWREYWSVFPLVLKLLFLAAFLEVLVTPFLLQLII